MSTLAAILLGGVILTLLVASKVKRWARSLPWCPLCRENRVLPTFEYCIACQLEHF